MINLNTLYTAINKKYLTDGQYQLEVYYNDKKSKTNGIVTIEWDGEYKTIDDSFSHEFGIEEGSHLELTISEITELSFAGIYAEDTNEHAEIELSLTLNRQLDLELQRQIEDLTVEK